VQEVPFNMPCIFKSDERELRHLDLAAGPAVGIEEEISESIFETTTANDGIKFWPWVNQV
jgi:chloride channel 3/4/5